MKWADDVAGMHRAAPHEEDATGDEQDAATAEHLVALVRAFVACDDVPTEPHEVARWAIWLRRLAYWTRRR